MQIQFLYLYMNSGKNPYTELESIIIIIECPMFMYDVINMLGSLPIPILAKS